MKNIQPNENNFQKNRLTELPITIVSGDTHKDGDNLELTRQRLEKSALYLMSVFSLLKVAALSGEGESEIRALRTFCSDAVNHCELGYGIADSILASASALTEFQPDDKSQPESEPESEKPNLDSFFAAKHRQTAERLEMVFASDKISNEVKNILEALVAEAAIEAGVSIPDTDEIMDKFPKIFGNLLKQASSFYVLYHAIETALNHGTSLTATAAAAAAAAEAAAEARNE